MDVVTLAHGSGGSLTGALINDLFRRHFDNPFLAEAHDAARLPVLNGKPAFTTDSYVINPLLFPGGNIGKLAVCGTVNDLAMSGARPLYLSCGFIIEDGLPLALLETVVRSMADAAREAGVLIVTGDTKVVNQGAADKLFINTAGIGEIPTGVDICGANAKPGDVVIISGTLGDHGATILLDREQLGLTTNLASDCAPLGGLVAAMLAVCPQIRVLRDPTRGGLATALNEIASQSKVCIELDETSIPVKPAVRGICEMLGLDPLYLANEGKLVAIVPADMATQILAVMKNHPFGEDSAIIGRVLDQPAGRLFMRTPYGSQRILDVMVSDPLPRIC
jgi:hydrogenase expression/formation protein HypE